MKKAKSYYAAIDLHSNNLFVAIVDRDGKRIRDARLFCEMFEVEKFLEPYRSRIAAVAVESTFNWYWLVDGLQDCGYEVVLANPAALVQYDGLKHSDDRTDAYFLAEILRLGIMPTGYIGNREWRAVRDLLRRRASLVAKRTSLILSLRNLQVRTMGHCPMPTPKLKAADRSEVVDLFADSSEKLTAEIQKSHIDELEASILRIEKHVLARASKLPHFAKLTGMPGIGRILAMTIILEIGEISRFRSPEAFASYARMVQSKRSSNGKRKGENNRKCGNRYLAWAFIEAANFIRRYDPRAQRWHDRKMAKTNAVVAKKALGCKIAKAVWHMLAEGSEYDGDRLFGPGRSSATTTTSPELKTLGGRPPASIRG
jgi:transposase